MLKSGGADTSKPVAVIPPVIGCKKSPEAERLTLPIGDSDSFVLVTVFSDEKVRVAAEHHRHLLLLVMAVGIIITAILSLVGFRWLVGRPMSRLHESIQQAVETGDRTPVGLSGANEFRDIASAFNRMLEKEVQREQRIEEVNAEISELNRSLEMRVEERTLELEASSERLRHLIENFSSGIYIHAKFKPIYANQTLLDMLGYKNLDEFLAMDSTDQVLAPEERERIWGYHTARLRGEPAPVSYDFWALKKNGVKLFVNNRSFTVDWDGEPAVCTTLFDLTDQQQVERSLAEQQHLMNSLMMNTREGFWFIDLDGKTTEVNPAMCEILGRRPVDITGKTIFDFVDEENKQIFLDQLKNRKEGRSTSYEISLQRPDGQNVPCLNNATPLYGLDGERCGSVGIWADISEIKGVQRRLEQETQRAQAANIAKSEFLAVASHELRTPMNGVLGMADLLLRSQMPEGQKRRVEIIKQSGEALLGLLNEILDVSKIESGRLNIEKSHFNFRRMVSRVTALMESPARDKGLDFKCQIDDSIPDILFGDVTRTRQVLINIVGNAVKFTESGHISISITEISGPNEQLELKFEVADTGPGVDVGDQEKIFEKFAQADASTTRNFGGTGLGLAICRELVEMLGGEIGVDSVIGEGPFFWFTLPYEVGDEAKLNEGEDDSNSRTLIHAPLQILVAEDNQINQEIAKDVLEEAGHIVDIAENGHEAVKAVENGNYDAVLMDSHMPEMDGIEATKIIRTLSDEKAKIPIIALTANAMVGDREKYLSMGMDDYVSKPFKAERLLSSIEFCVHGSVVSREDMPSLEMAAHTLKSSSANMGATRLSELCRSLEVSAQTASVSEMQKLIFDMQMEYLIVSAALLDSTSNEAISTGADGKPQGI